MNEISFENFFLTITEDVCISSTHISLYLAMMYKWKEQGCPECIEINRTELMALSKINARTTYDKCLHSLNELGYIKYSRVIGCKKSTVQFRKL